jgi:hypothetical protein
MDEKNLKSENPFCTRRIRPGAAPFIFPPGLDAEKFLDRLRGNGWLGAIVGPHGSGKSSLLAEIISAADKHKMRTVRFELHDGCRRMPGGWKNAINAADSFLSSAMPDKPAAAANSSDKMRQAIRTIVAVDGYEQLNAWSRFRLKLYCRRRVLGLLLTSHSSTGLPELFRTTATPELTMQIVAQLVQGGQFSVSANVIADLFSRHGGNVREVLFDLYDLCEQQSPKTQVR